MRRRHRAAARPADFAASQHRDAGGPRGHRRAISRNCSERHAAAHARPRTARRSPRSRAICATGARGAPAPRWCKAAGRAGRGRIRHHGDDRARRRPPPDLAHRRRGRSRSRAGHAVLRLAGGARADRQARRRRGRAPAIPTPRSSRFPRDWVSNRRQYSRGVARRQRRQSPLARLLSDKMGAALGQPVVIENRPGGAGGTIGGRSVIAADPDGHTLMMGSTSTILIAPLIVKNAGYSSETFTPVAGLSESTEVLAVHTSVAANSVAELVSLAKSQPGMLRYGSAGVGTLPHIEGELLKARAQIEMQPHSLSRRRSGADRPFGRRGSNLLLCSHANAAVYS